MRFFLPDVASLDYGTYKHKRIGFYVIYASIYCINAVVKLNTLYYAMVYVRVGTHIMA